MTSERTKVMRRARSLAKGIPERPYSCFLPKGRSGLFIYAVVVADHPEVVKIGRTIRWTNRRKAYANWNLRPGDAITSERVFTITDEFVDLTQVEMAILDAAPWPRRSGNEWFVADHEDVCRHIEEILCSGGLSYV